MLPHLVEADVGRGHLRLAAVLQVWQTEVLEYQRGQLVERDLGLVVVDSWLLASARPLTRSLALLIVAAGNYVADLGFSIALAGLLVPPPVESKAGQIERPNRDLHDLVAIGGDDRFLAHDVR